MLNSKRTHLFSCELRRTHPNSSQLLFLALRNKRITCGISIRALGCGDPGWEDARNTAIAMDFSKAMGILQQRSEPKAADTSHCVDCSEEATDILASPATGEVDLDPLGAAKLLRLLLSRQEERVAVYRRFNDGFETFLKVRSYHTRCRAPML